MTERATPFYCPYCGDEDLRPEENGGWLCSACRRVFSVKFIGLSLPPAEAKSNTAEARFPAEAKSNTAEARSPAEAKSNGVSK